MFVFEMPKVVRIRNVGMGLVYRGVQFMLLVYFVFFVMWWKKGYQTFSEPICGVTAKVRGIAFTEHYEWNGTGWASEWLLWDSGEYYLQPLQQAGFQLVTHMGPLTYQTKGYCAETEKLPDAKCLSDADCQIGGTAGHSTTGPDGVQIGEEDIDLEEDGHGVLTGKCLSPSETCEVYAWCPVSFGTESVSLKHPQLATSPNVLEEPYCFFKDISFIDEIRKKIDPLPRDRIPFFDVLNFTVLIKSAVEFPEFRVQRVNILPWMNHSYLRKCLYDPEHPLNKFCPIFRVHDILRLANGNITSLIFYGGLISINVHWECDLDWHIENCSPKYTFGHLDSSPDGSEYNLHGAEGLSSEFTLHFGIGNRTHAKKSRLLIHTRGINFIIRATGRAGKFSLLSFTMRLGSGLALFSVGTIVCDFFVFHLTADRQWYRAASCDDKTLKRLLRMTATASLAQSRRTQLHLGQQLQTDWPVTISNPSKVS